MVRKIGMSVVVASLAGCGGPAPSAGAGSDGGQNQGICASDKVAQPFSAGMHQATPAGTTVSVVSDPPRPAEGDKATWSLSVTDPSGAPVVGAAVGVSCVMTHNRSSHGCPFNITVKDEGAGTYVASPVTFNMPGHWQVLVAVGKETATFELCIE
jgi:hypothetical protein